LCPAQFPGAFDPVAANDLIEINSNDRRPYQGTGNISNQPQAA
jgi:hypothetical protein